MNIEQLVELLDSAQLLVSEALSALRAELAKRSQHASALGVRPAKQLSSEDPYHKQYAERIASVIESAGHPLTPSEVTRRLQQNPLFPKVKAPLVNGSMLRDASKSNGLLTRVGRIGNKSDRHYWLRKLSVPQGWRIRVPDEN